MLLFRLLSFGIGAYLVYVGVTDLRARGDRRMTDQQYNQTTFRLRGRGMLERVSGWLFLILGIGVISVGIVAQSSS